MGLVVGLGRRGGGVEYIYIRGAPPPPPQHHALLPPLPQVTPSNELYASPLQPSQVLETDHSYHKLHEESCGGAPLSKLELHWPPHLPQPNSRLEKATDNGNQAVKMVQL